MLTDSQTSIEFEESRGYTKNSAYINDTGIWVPCHEYSLKGTSSHYKMLISKDLFIEAYNKWIRSENNE